ncbi:hypothetical protein, partial [Listeria monocytogenes]|uniref:hypothetical protein n=1 Tax=Listeria monocytogenes TaxID=1639 RepID=UPI003FA4C37C
MPELPDHVTKNRDYWSSMAHTWVEPGRRSWESDEITWGIWDVRESDIHALGDTEELKGKDSIELGC